MAVRDRAIAGRAQRHREAFVGFDRGVARDIDGHDLARLAGGKVNRTGRQGAAKVVGIGGSRAAAGDRITHAGGGREIARAADGEGKGGVAAVAFGLDRRQGGDRQVGQRQNIIEEKIVRFVLSIIIIESNPISAISDDEITIDVAER